MSNQVAVKIMADSALKFLDEIDRLEQQVHTLQGFLNNVVTGWKNDTLTPDRIKVLENGEMRIVAAEPAETPADKFANLQSPDPCQLPANGKTEETAETNPLADLQEGDGIKPVEVGSNGHSDT